MPIEKDAGMGGAMYDTFIQAFATKEYLNTLLILYVIGFVQCISVPPATLSVDIALQYA